MCNLLQNHHQREPELRLGLSSTVLRRQHQVQEAELKSMTGGRGRGWGMGRGGFKRDSHECLRASTDTMKHHDQNSAGEKRVNSAHTSLSVDH